MEDELHMRMHEYVTQVEDPTLSDARSDAAAARLTGVEEFDTEHEDAKAETGNEIDAEDLLGSLSRFVEGPAGISGAKPEPSSFSLDVNALMALLKPPGGQQDSCTEGSDVEDVFSDENDSEESDSDDDSNHDEDRV
jgi:hypothetical protein